MMAAGVRTSATSVETDTPYELFPVSFPGLGGGPGYTYDVTADGQRFLVLEAVGPGEGHPAQLTVVTNWQAGLAKITLTVGDRLGSLRNPCADWRRRHGRGVSARATPS